MSNSVEIAKIAHLIIARIGRTGPSVMSTTRQISDDTRIPFSRVKQALKLLSKMGLVGSVKGVNGGYRLIQPDRVMSMDELVTILATHEEGALLATSRA